MSVVKFRVTGASITLLTRKAVSARQRHESREGKMAFVFLRRRLVGFKIDKNFTMFIFTPDREHRDSEC